MSSSGAQEIVQQLASSSETNLQPDSQQVSRSSAPHSTESPPPTSPPTSAFAPSKPTSSCTTTAAEVKTCWICQCTSIEDTPQSSPWRSPCPCSLQAHESCLLEWVDSQATQAASSSSLECPVCKNEIRISQPQRRFIRFIEACQFAGRKGLGWLAIGAAGGILHSGLTVYGANILQVVFGMEKGRLMISPSRSWPWSQLSGPKGMVLKSFYPFLIVPGQVNIGSLLGLPLIAPVLIALRMGRVGDYICYALPIAYTLMPLRSRPTSYKPSPGEVFFGGLPILRNLYFAVYQSTFSNLEKNWDLAVQRKAREGETAEQIAQAANRDGDIGLEIDIQFGHNMLDEDAINDAQLGFGEQVQAPEAPQANIQPPAMAEPDNPATFGLPRNFSILDTIFLTLFYPAISSVVGDALFKVLPVRLTRTNLSRVSFWSSFGGGKEQGGIFEEKWMRTVLGGCAVVVVKDAIILYYKWRRAKDWGKRRVRDYVG